MGIKGIYKEIGSGKRISLMKLAVDKLEETGRPFRLAIDISIWQFQAQAARGGTNPAVRTLFYRLLRLLSLSIQPIFVFDGPNKPAFKRHKRSGRGDGLATAMAKRLIRLFGFQAHDAPGEAEAECALLQQSGIVDAVLSEDVDTIMFGCTRTLRNWSSEGTKGNKTPNHVSMYDTEDMRQGESGLDREGMVLVALMSGGDYLPEGIPGAGVKLACEAARAGFGKSLCRLKRSDVSELASWKEYLTYELRHNESGFFRTRHKALTVPADFPNMEILRYYTHPVVSPASTLDRLKQQQQDWKKPVDIPSLREFARETFDWDHRAGAVKFIRVLAPCLLVSKLMEVKSQQDPKQDLELAKSITSRRTHFSTDATSELRLSFIPTDVVGYDFQNEPDEIIEYGRDGLALNSDDELEALGEGEGTETIGNPVTKKPFNPTDADLVWIPEVIARIGIPHMLGKWEEAQISKATTRGRTKPSRQKAKAGGMATGALDKFVKATKNIAQSQNADATKALPLSITNPAALTGRESALHPNQLSRLAHSSIVVSQGTQKTQSTRHSKPPMPGSRSSKSIPAAPEPDTNTNPWAMASLQGTPRAARPTSKAAASEPILISSSPPASPAESMSAAMRRCEVIRDMKRSSTSGLLSLSSHSAGLHERRSVTPPVRRRRPVNDIITTSDHGRGRPLSPPAGSAERPRRKLARTESLPTASMSPAASSRPRTVRGLARAHTVAVETIPSDTEGGDNSDDDDDDDDFDLPPLSSLVSKIPADTTMSKAGRSLLMSSTAVTGTAPVAAQKPRPQDSSGHGSVGTANGNREQKRHENQKQKQKQKQKQTTLATTFETRTTKLYVPRKSEPGFFREVEVGVDEAGVLLLQEEDDDDDERYGFTSKGTDRITGVRGRKGGGKDAVVCRRSDLSCIDLTGDD